MSGRTAVEELIRRVRRRFVLNVLLGEAAIAMVVATGSLVALLVVGTQLLDWLWLLFLVFGSLIVAVVRFRRRLPSLYYVAQRIDRLLGLEDTLSTAFFFRHLAGARRVSGGIAEAQRRMAEEVSRNIDARSALPIGAPRALHAVWVLALAAAGLFGLRYLLTRSLDLRPPIVSVPVFDVFKSIPRDQAAQRQERSALHPPSFPETAPQALDPAAKRDRTEAASGAEPGADSTDASAEAMRRPQRGSEITAPGEEGSEAANATARNSEAAQDLALQDSPSDRSGQPRRPPGARQENSPLLDKLRDAMADLLSRLKIQPPPGEMREASADTPESARGGRQKQSPAPGGAPDARGQEREGGAAGDQADAEGAGNHPGAKGKATERASGQNSTGEERSGMGKEEGSKELREAEQLAAMGKISEILGKRSAAMTGEVMVEVTSGRWQDLKTPYSERMAEHADTGGEIHRDEVPLVFQNYVERYFEQVRRAPPRER